MTYETLLKWKAIYEKRNDTDQLKKIEENLKKYEKTTTQKIPSPTTKTKGSK